MLQRSEGVTKALPSRIVLESQTIEGDSPVDERNELS